VLVEAGRGQVVAGRAGAEADHLVGSVTPGKKADLVLIKNDASPALFPLLHPYGTVVYQAGRGDVHTVLVDGRVVKHEGALVGGDLAAAKGAVGETVAFARSTMGEAAWEEGMHPELPVTERVPNPYTYTDFTGSDDRHQPQQGPYDRA
jgi:hypothetical protein